jgi:hypothetical protein
MMLSRTPDLTGEMEHFQHDTFIVRWKERNFNADAYVTFALDDPGRQHRAREMKAVSTETDFSYDFHDPAVHAGEAEATTTSSSRAASAKSPRLVTSGLAR